MSITKSHIVDKIFKEAGYSKKESAELVDLIFKIMKSTLASGEKVKISGFGNFTLKDKAQRVGRNPQTGSAMKISARRVLTFRPSQILKDDITQRYVHRIDDNGEENTNLPPKNGVPRSLSTTLKNLDEQQLRNEDSDFDIESDHLDD